MIDTQKKFGVSSGIAIMIITQLVLLGLSMILELYNLYYVIFKSPFEGVDLVRNIAMHVFLFLMFGILILYVTIGWKKEGTIHFKGVLYMFILTLIAGVICLYDVAGTTGGILVTVDIFFIIILHQKLRDERDAELINWLIILINVGITIGLFLTEPSLVESKVMNKLLYLAPVFISLLIAIDYEGNFDRIAIRRSDREDEWDE